MGKLAQIKSMVQKVLKDDDPSIDIDASTLMKPKPHLPSGSTVLDYLIGGRPNRFGILPCPGWPRGLVSQIYGHESSGKTTVALTCAAETCRRGGTVMFIDWEHAISPDYAAVIGVPIMDPDQFYLVQPNTLEDGLKVLWIGLKAGVDLIILDSVGAGVPQAIFNQTVEEQGDGGRMGAVAGIWSKFLPKISAVASKTGTHVMGISQLRKNISKMGMGPDTAPQGGEAWKFYAGVRMQFRRTKSLKTKDYDATLHKVVERTTSAEVLAKVDKCKVAGTAQAEATFFVAFGSGIDDLRSLVEIGTAHGILKKSGAWYSWDRGNGSVLKGCGTDEFRKNLINTPNAQDELKAAVMEAMYKSGKDTEIVVTDEAEDFKEEDFDLGEDLEAILSGKAPEAKETGYEVLDM